MHLKLLFTVLSMLFLTDGGSGSGGGDGDGNSGGDGGKEGDGEGGEDDVAGLKSALEKERKNASDAGKKLRGLQKQLDDLKNANKPDDEKIKAAEARAEAAEKRVRESNGRVAVTDAATKAKAIEPAAIFALVRDGLDYDDDGEPTNVSTVIAQAKKTYPSLFKAAAGDGDGGKGGDTGNKKDINALLRQAAGKA